LIIFIRKKLLHALRNFQDYLSEVSLSKRSHPETPFPGKAFSKKSPGQVALMMILLIAIALIFLAVIMNMGRIAQTKTLVTVASNTSAAVMASLMASQAEYMFQVTLGGPEETDGELSVCGWTGVAAAIVAILIIVVSALTGQFEGVVLAISIILAVANLALQVLVVQPGLTDMWNKQIKKLSQADQYVERGIITAMQAVVDDQAELRDTIDIDEDGIFGAQEDLVSRYGYAYYRRLNNLAGAPLVDREIIKKFKDALGEFVYRAYKPESGVCINGTLPYCDDNWGIWDPVGYTCYSDPGNGCCMGDPTTCSICNDPDSQNPCCSIDRSVNFQQCGKCDVTPSQVCCTAGGPGECNPCCRPNGGKCDVNGKNCEPKLRPSCCDSPDATVYCGTASTCPNTFFPWVYDANYEDSSNGFVSFREFFGHDDESRFLLNNQPDLQRKFRYQDAQGLYSFFWNGANTGLETNISEPDENHCFWCDQRATPPPINGQTCDVNNTYLQLPAASTCSGPDCCVRVGTDRVPDITDMQVSGNSCYNPTLSIWWWKQGVNQFCSTHWPYNNCPGEMCAPGDLIAGCDQTTSCCYCDQVTCPQPPPNPPNPPCCQLANPACPALPAQGLWVGDGADQIRYGMDDFIKWAKTILSRDVDDLAASFMQWYPEADGWLSTTTGGSLNKWTHMMNDWKNKIKHWRESEYGGTDPGDLCFPGGPAFIPDIRDCVLTLRDNACLSNPDSDDCHKYDTRWGFLRDIYTESGLVVNKLIEAANFDTCNPSIPPNGTCGKIPNFIFHGNVVALKTEFDRLLAESKNNQRLEPFAIYGWTTKVNPDDPDPNSSKLWHIVRVDARVPGRCGGKCGRDFWCSGRTVNREPGLPYVKTYTEDLDTRRCYALGDSFNVDGCCDEVSEYTHEPGSCFRGGVVKSRVIRWDQDRDFVMKFANAVPIWKFIFHHPGVTSNTDPNVAIGALETSCAGAANGSFMLNGDREVGCSPPSCIPNDAANTACSNAARTLLQRGVMSKTCAEYFWHDQGQYSRGFSVKFSSGECKFD